ncbi:uncharacterized protein BT62DRAFT_924363 [Guyanagaster necrorhizus]|uniref:Uncharacterized protein n=1 Tax=Guyanagaster necrorhizus TaxID=856835 RepID=A0A9P8ALT9_9AGAR|nr:uncharacterized protein BT62DRAFT_924363 [Guyanagaster necrorhizus MCA 3950]KAG7439986.1 hypothetical protein BT62DRAFT_924363 [Guyanagaster necrorhizus MCA 3950]
MSHSITLLTSCMRTLPKPFNGEQEVIESREKSSSSLVVLKIPNAASALLEREGCTPSDTVDRRRGATQIYRRRPYNPDFRQRVMEQTHRCDKPANCRAVMELFTSVRVPEKIRRHVSWR